MTSEAVRKIIKRQTIGRAWAWLVAVALLTSFFVLRENTPSSAAVTVVPPPPGAIVVGTASGTCPNPRFATIEAAVLAAPAGATIYVCAGLYHEDVLITKNLTLLGAQWGRDARQRTNPAAETIVSSATDQFGYISAETGTINGFTLRGTPGVTGIIVLSSNPSGFTWINNIIEGDQTGINFHASGAVLTLIKRNQITGTGPGPGSGVFFSAGPANDVTITQNSFSNNGAAINTTGEGVSKTTPLSQDLIVTNNVSIDDGNFIALFLTDHVQIVGNRIIWTNPADTNAGSAMFISGGNMNVGIGQNYIQGGASTGINLNNQFHSSLPSTNIAVVLNTITLRLNGIRISPSFDNGPAVENVTISTNAVSFSGDNGIWVQSGSQSQITGNVVQGSVSADCRDETTGGGTAGTADIWSNDFGLISAPPGLCIG